MTWGDELEKVRHRRAIAGDRVEVLGVALAGNALVMVADVGRMAGDVGHAGLLPETEFLAPVVGRALAGRHPDLQPDRRRVAPLGLDQLAQLVEGLQRLVACRIGQRHEAVAVLGGAPEGRLGMAAEPDRHAARLRPRVDAAVVELVELALERHAGLGPQLLHEAHLLLGALAAAVEVDAQALELDLVPADADAQAKAALAQRIEAGRLLGDQGGLALGQDHDAGRETHLLRDTRQEGEQHEGIVIGRGRRPDALAAVIDVGIAAQHMVGAEQVAESQPLGPLRIVAQDGRAGADVTDRQRCAKKHRSSPRWSADLQFRSGFMSEPEARGPADNERTWRSALQTTLPPPLSRASGRSNTSDAPVHSTRTGS